MVYSLLNSHTHTDCRRFTPTPLVYLSHSLRTSISPQTLTLHLHTHIYVEKGKIWDGHGMVQLHPGPITNQVPFTFGRIRPNTIARPSIKTTDSLISEICFNTPKCFAMFAPPTFALGASSTHLQNSILENQNSKMENEPTPTQLHLGSPFWRPNFDTPYIKTLRTNGDLY